jgi:hypothetical protein
MPSGQHLKPYQRGPARTLSATEPLDVEALREENRQLRELGAHLCFWVVGKVVGRRLRAGGACKRVQQGGALGRKIADSKNQSVP